jgi:hypothetical protein
MVVQVALGIYIMELSVEIERFGIVM